MSIEVKVPQLPESVSDATLVAWHKRPGDPVSRDENLVDLETDKVVLEVPAPAAGVLKEIKVDNGATVTSGQLLAVIEEGEAVATAPAGEVAAATDSGTAGASGAPAAAVATAPPVRSGPAAAESQVGGGPPAEGATKLSPSVRRLLEEHDLDPAQIPGSGRGGRILKSDVLAFLNRPVQPEAVPEDQPIAVAPAADRSEHRVPMSRLRARIAERMVEAQRNAAMLTTFNEVDLSEVIALRARHKEAFEKTHGVRLGFMSFFVRASIEALRRFPVVNASVEGNEIVYHDYYDIGIAVSSERGLLVPVVRDADRLGFADIEKAIDAFARKAREGTIAMEDLTGGTFTITNGGIFGSMLSTPILNPPQSGILGMHRIQSRPVVVDGEIAARPMMYLALTYDHRIIDGREAVQFLVTVKEALEDPGRLLLQV
ncbi:MAG: 2-oxoglutarate dehydrogenase complex dihydrolipoyllysine-residue succinyltransferase [Gammaproteobacteria bacterium]|nr:MAG: 2-oxoglutarate dehydrogenase complex dihydrolipoyllysine-residue succinyltransferase [Gammaproteobacteria bacterium]